MRRKPGALVPLEESILSAAFDLRRRSVDEFHGYQIAKYVADVSDSKLLTAYGTLYRALSRMEKAGLLRSRWEDPQHAAAERRPGRRMYALTDDGLEVARATRRARVAAKTSKARRRRVAPA